MLPIFLCNISKKALKLQQHTFPAEGNTEIPLFSLKMTVPPDGYPPKIQWERFAESIFHGFEKHREPIEIYPSPGVSTNDPLFGNSVCLAKGYSRCSILLFGIVQTLKKEDQATFSEAERDFFTQRLGLDLKSLLQYTAGPSIGGYKAP